MEQSVNQNKTFLEFLPVSFFGGIMGLSGLCFAWRSAHNIWLLPRLIGEIIGLIAILSFIALSLTYLIKWKRYPNLVRGEFSHPVSVSFFATIIISLLLIPGIIRPYYALFAFWLWVFAAAMMFFFAIYVIRKWLDNVQNPENALPAWVLPVVGTLDVPIVGSSFDHAGAREVCILFFGVGIIFAIILLPIIISRLLFQPQLPVLLQPTLMILTGPFALAFSGYIALNYKQDFISAVFFYFNIFLFCILSSKILYIPRSCPFRATWWAVSFPLVAITLSSFHYFEAHNDIVHYTLAAIFLALSTLVISYLFFQTIYRITTNSFDA